MINEIRAGQTLLSDGTVGIARATRIGALATGDAQGRYYEQAFRGNIFSLVLAATTGTVAAGNVNGAAAGASTQFALWNPAGSGKNLSLLDFHLGLFVHKLQFQGVQFLLLCKKRCIVGLRICKEFTHLEPFLCEFVSHIASFLVIAGFDFTHLIHLLLGEIEI